MHSLHEVGDVKVSQNQKQIYSGVNLNAPGIIQEFASIAEEDLKRILRWNEKPSVRSESKRLPPDSLGLRVSQNFRLVKGNKSKKVFHRVGLTKMEIQLGSVCLRAEDYLGNKTEFILESGDGIWIPSYILYDYEIITTVKLSRIEKVFFEEAQLIIISSVLKINKDQLIDLYSQHEFRELQKEYQKKGC